MKQQSCRIGCIPAILWGEPSDKVYIHVHGKMSRKEHAETFARIAETKGWQTLSFDLAEHGERNDDARLDIFSGIRDLTAVADYAFPRWKRVALYACSIGAYFSLNAYSARPFEKCLFQSPVADMEYLVRQMMRWFSVTPERLQQEGEIDTPVDPLRWDYYQYILSHPVESWPIPTSILYAGRDDLQSAETMRRFADRFGCALTVSPDSQHPFMEPGDEAIVTRWLTEHI